MEKEGEVIKRYFFWGLVIAILILSFLVVKFFITAVISAFILAYLLRPLHLKLSKKIPEKYSVLVIIFLTLILILIILFIVFQSIVTELISALSEENLRAVVKSIQELDSKNLIGSDITPTIQEISTYLLKIATSTLTKIPGIFISVVVILFSLYYFLIDWEKIEGKIINLLPFKNKITVFKKLEETVWQIAVVTLFIAITEAIIATIVFTILGIKYAILIGFLIGILAFIPGIGPAIVWLPLSLFQFAYGNYIVALGVLITGIIITYGIDLIIRTRMMGARTAIHPIIMLIGVLGGIQMFGLIGFIIGPLILSILITIIENIPKAK